MRATRTIVPARLDQRRRRALSLVEVFIAALILSVLAALAIPRLTRAAAPLDPAARLQTDLRILRVAIAGYYQDHDAYPGATSDGVNPGQTEAAFVAQLTQFTDAAGHVSAAADAAHRYGPYLRNGVPACVLFSGPGASTVRLAKDNVAAAAAADANPAGWTYDCATGLIAIDSTAADSTGRPYASY